MQTFDFSHFLSTHNLYFLHIQNLNYVINLSDIKRDLCLEYLLANKDS